MLRRVAAATVLSGLALSASATDVSIAGFAFSGDFQSAAERFPYTFKLFRDQEARGGGANSYSRLVVGQAGAIKNAAYQFSPGAAVGLGNDRALMSVLVLTGETVDTENYGGYYKTFVNLRGDTLIFDYKSQTIVRSCPVSVALFDATPQPPSRERIAGFVDNLLRRPDARGLISQFARCLEQATPPREGKHTVQVRQSDISPEALAQFPAAMRAHPAAVQAMLADSLGSVLAARLGISMLPNNIGHAVGGIMSMRLESGDDIKLKLGEGDYVFDLKLNKFAKIKTAETDVSATYVYGAFMTLNFLEPQLNTSFIATNLKNGETAVLPAGQVNSDDFAAYQDAIRGLYTKFADALSRPGSKWLDSAASVQPIEPQMAAARTTLETCK
ncbi:hypothetical protein [Rugamonas sp.]|uniref:hypothetical protein n=1 Tax=Rugamonas sp. TaxID=1926287 RepID=UPI0025EDD5B5|nr:hypothetical protein [Rugamonas sp.]